MAMLGTCAVAQREIPGRGVGLVAARDINAGETVVSEHALLVGVSEDFRETCCASCLAPGATTRCAGCHQVVLCGADACTHGSGHGAVVCAAERVASTHRPPMSIPDRERLRFLSACAELRRLHVVNGDANSRGILDATLQLCPAVGPNGEGIDAREASAAERVQPALEAAVKLATIAHTDATKELLGIIAGDLLENASLLAKETKNAFGIMAPHAASSSGHEGEAHRRVRGGAVYQLSSRVNHGCFPNVARFDNFDGVLASQTHEFHRAPSDLTPSPTELRLVAMDKIPAGHELLMSYLPVNEPCASRRRRVRRTFGFSCQCERCALEVEWAVQDDAPTGDEPDGSAFASTEGGAEGGAESNTELAWDAADAAVDAALEEREASAFESISEDERTRRADRIPATYALWFVRNMCPVDGCGGTLAPPHTRADHMTCNYCGENRTDEQFFAQLQG